MCIYKRIHAHVYIHKRQRGCRPLRCESSYTYLRLLRIYTYVCIYVYIHMYIYMDINIYIYSHVYLYICIYVCIYLCVYVYYVYGADALRCNFISTSLPLLYTSTSVRLSFMYAYMYIFNYTRIHIWRVSWSVLINLFRRSHIYLHIYVSCMALMLCT